MSIKTFTLILFLFLSLLLGLIATTCEHPMQMPNSSSSTAPTPNPSQAKLPTTKQLVPQTHFFRDIIGLSETDFKKLPVEQRAQFVKTVNQNGTQILKLRRTDGVEFQAGHFRVATVLALGKEIGPGKELSAPLGKFSVVEGIGTNPQSPWIDQVDVRALQAKPENRLATFQGASNGNALETTSAGQNVDNQLLESYPFDKTQGPALSMSGGPGLIQRRYYTYFNPAKPPASWEQSQKVPVNFWSLLSAQLDVTPAGYVQFTAAKPSAASTPEDVQKIGVGIQSFVQVSHGGSEGAHGSEHYYLADPDQIVHQVYTAAVDLAGTNGAFIADPVKLSWANLILKGAYVGTVFAAVSLKSHKVIVTLVGGGVFGNNWAEIVKAILFSVNELWHYPIDMDLIIFTNGTGGGDRLAPQATIKTRATQGTRSLREHLLAVVKASKGTYIQYSAANPGGKQL